MTSEGSMVVTRQQFIKMLVSVGYPSKNAESIVTEVENMGLLVVRMMKSYQAKCKICGWHDEPRIYPHFGLGGILGCPNCRKAKRHPILEGCYGSVEEITKEELWVRVDGLLEKETRKP